ncbi:MAG: response regulator [Desulfobacterales bacterium]|nr:response regulator [Desulfobacterales bacterium]
MRKILVVDDDAALAAQLEERLAIMGDEVVGRASSGEAAIEMAERLRPDLVIMDIVMPGEIDGIKAAKIMKQDLDIPAVFLTGYAEDEFIEKAKSVEPYGYIVKPVAHRELKAVIDIALYKKDMERRLQEAHKELEKRIEERTSELSETNERLREEIRDRKKAEEILKEREKDLEGKGIRLEEFNAALKILLEKRDEDRKELEEKVIANVNQMVLPYVAKLKSTRLDALQETFTDIIESNLDAIISPFLRKLSSKYLNLTPRELRVADLIRQGLSTKEIGNLLNSSPETISRHRKRIRKKLQLNDKKSNLRTHLLALQ